MPNLRKKNSCSIFDVYFLHFILYVLRDIMGYYLQGYYDLTVRFRALILEILWKIYVTEFSYWTYNGTRCIDICDCVNGWASSLISYFFSQWRGQILLWIFLTGASIALHVSDEESNRMTVLIPSSYFTFPIVWRRVK